MDTRDLGPVYALTGVLDPLPYVVEDTGGRGRHIWVFFEPGVPAAEARAWAQQVVTAAGVSCEVYPKQDSLPEGQLGNLIRLPFGVNRKTGQRSRVLHGEFKTLDAVPSIVVESKAAEVRRAPEDGWLAAMWEGDVSPAGGRNNTLNRFYWWLLRRGFPQEVARELCEKANDGFNPPLDQAEFEKVVRERRDV